MVFGKCHFLPMDTKFRLIIFFIIFLIKLIKFDSSWRLSNGLPNGLEISSVIVKSILSCFEISFNLVWNDLKIFFYFWNFALKFFLKFDLSKIKVKKLNFQKKPKTMKKNSKWKRKQIKIEKIKKIENFSSLGWWGLLKKIFNFSFFSCTLSVSLKIFFISES